MPQTLVALPRAATRESRMRVKNFLLVYNWRDSRLDHWRDLDREIEGDELTTKQARRL
jgi:hypothetical protein